jgi:hypothetical protein
MENNMATVVVVDMRTISILTVSASTKSILEQEESLMPYNSEVSTEATDVRGNPTTLEDMVDTTTDGKDLVAALLESMEDQEDWLIDSRSNTDKIWFPSKVDGTKLIQTTEPSTIQNQTLPLKKAEVTLPENKPVSSPLRQVSVQVSGALMPQSVPAMLLNNP